MPDSTVIETLVKVAVPALVTLTVGGLAWIARQGAQYFATIWETKQAKWAAGMNQLMVLAELVVIDIEANERSAIKEATADGRISKEEGGRLFTIAKERIIAMAKEKGFSEAQKLLGVMAPDASSLLSGIIERAVATLPTSAPTPRTVMNVYGDPALPLAATVQARP